MKSILDRILSIRITVKSIALIAIGIAIAMIINSVMSDGGGRASSRDLEPLPTSTTTAPTTTTTTSTTTTTTTTTTVPPAPKSSKNSLMSEVEKEYPGASKRYTESVVRAGAEKACRDFNAGANMMGAVGSLKNFYSEEYSVDDFQLATAVVTAALKSLCPINAAYPKGYREY